MKEKIFSIFGWFIVLLIIGAVLWLIRYSYIDYINTINREEVCIREAKIISLEHYSCTKYDCYYVYETDKGRWEDNRAFSDNQTICMESRPK